MRKIHKIRTQAHRRYRRHLRVRHKVAGSPERPRLVVFRSSKHIYAQVVDDVRGVTLVGAGDTSEGIQVDGKGKTARSFALGRLIAAKAKAKGIAKVVFDRGGYQYHGRVKAVADGARKGGLEL
jgi:large subunit ribosomal protein L18